MSDPKSGSVPENKTGFTVAASPLNPVKLELGIILIIGFFLFFIVSSVIDSQIVQIGVLSGFGCLSMFWIVYRVRKLMGVLDDQAEK